MIEIKHRFGLSVLYTSTKTTVKEALIEASLEVANLEGADLRGANLRGTSLRGADLRGAKNIKSFQCGAYNRVSFAIKWNDCIMFKIGCFWGNTREAIKKVSEKYGVNSDYEKLINLYTDMLNNER